MVTKMRKRTPEERAADHERMEQQVRRAREIVARGEAELRRKREREAARAARPRLLRWLAR
jgi:TfoX/Sxy family transcriptional regulator of competence genes